MKKSELSLSSVFEQLPRALLYYLLGLFLGAVFGYLIFIWNKKFFEFLLKLWSERILFGISMLGIKYSTLWIILNNIIALLLVVVASIFIIMHISKTPTFLISGKFKSLEKHRPRITLLGLYMIPVGALLINGFAISFFASYVLLNFGLEKFTEAAALLLPHGINESLALLLASSLGLAYLKILSPFILHKKWNACIKTGKMLLRSNVTFFIVALIIILVIFSGFVEGALSLFLVR